MCLQDSQKGKLALKRLVELCFNDLHDFSDLSEFLNTFFQFYLSIL